MKQHRLMQFIQGGDTMLAKKVSLDITSEPLLEEVRPSSACPVSRWTSPEWFRRINVSQQLALSIIILLAAWGLVDISTRLFHICSTMLIRQLPPCWCGTSDTEAKAMGCIYDHIAVDWLPPHCVDSDLVDEFDRSGPEADGRWPYYELDADRTFNRINSSDIDSYASEGRDYWATLEWHVAHCMFIWRKQFRSSFRDGAVEPWNMKEAHTEHCHEFVMGALRERRPLWQVETLIPGRDRHIGE